VTTEAAGLADAVAIVARRRRSIRAFDGSRDVDQATVDQLLDVARWAPSGANAQPWEFLVIRDSSMRQQIVELYLDQVETKQRMEEAVWKRKLTTGNVGFRHAPVLLLVLADVRVVRSFPVRTIREKGRDHLMTSMANATLLMHLAAAARGLATQWVSDVSSPYMSTMLKDWLGIPEHMEIYDMVPIGWPATVPSSPPRRALAELIHRERYEPRLQRDEAALEAFLWSQTRLASFGARPGEPAGGVPEGNAQAGGREADGRPAGDPPR
jgi:5,6-dimethylbenzimidazole synthase